MDELQRQLKAFSKTYGLRGQLMEDRIKALIEQGKSPKEAIEQVFKEFGVEDWLQASVSSVIVETAKDALGMELAGQLSEAVLLEALSNPWDGSGLTLSKKIHGTSESMKEVIVETVQNQIRLNKTVKDTAQALYDGYQHGSIVRQQDLPKYMDDLIRWTRRSRKNLTEAEMKDLQRAIRKVRAQADELIDDKSTYNHFRTSLRTLLDRTDKGSEKSVQKAISAAIEEKSRYVAERIARTEAARARYDAFIARYGEDDSVAAYKWTLGSRHPVEDICDLYAEADLYGLGKGVFPKDKAPVCPAHPHCLCHYAPVYESEIEGRKPSKDIEANGNAWLKKQPLTVQEKILGVKGRLEWKAGRASWMEKARNISPVFEKKESRLSGAVFGALNDKNDPWLKKRDKHARLYYQEIKNSDKTSIINKISKNAKVRKNIVKNAYEHLFENQYRLGNGQDQFAPDYDMAQSLQRLITGVNIQKHDVILLHHESLEKELMTRYNYEYKEAHRIVCKKYNYEKALRLWKGGL